MASSQVYHVRNPMARDIQWIEPLQADNPRAGTRLGLAANPIQPMPEVGRESLSLLRGTDGLSDPFNITDHIVDAGWAEGQEVGTASKRLHGLGELIGSYGTDVTQVLYQDEIRLSPMEGLFIQTIEWASGCYQLLDSLIDRRTCRVVPLD